MVLVVLFFFFLGMLFGFVWIVIFDWMCFVDVDICIIGLFMLV